MNDSASRDGFFAKRVGICRNRPQHGLLSRDLKVGEISHFLLEQHVCDFLECHEAAPLG